MQSGSLSDHLQWHETPESEIVSIVISPTFTFFDQMVWKKRNQKGKVKEFHYWKQARGNASTLFFHPKEFIFFSHFFETLNWVVRVSQLEFTPGIVTSWEYWLCLCPDRATVPTGINAESQDENLKIIILLSLWTIFGIPNDRRKTVKSCEAIWATLLEAERWCDLLIVGWLKVSPERQSEELNDLIHNVPSQCLFLSALFNHSLTILAFSPLSASKNHLFISTRLSSSSS